MSRGDVSQPNTKEVISPVLRSFLDNRHPPKTFCPSEVARRLSAQELTSLGFTEWRGAMPAIRELVWELRDSGQLEVVQKGEVLGAEVGVDDVRGPIRVRRMEGGKHGDGSGGEVAGDGDGGNGEG